MKTSEQIAKIKAVILDFLRVTDVFDNITKRKYGLV